MRKLQMAIVALFVGMSLLCAASPKKDVKTDTKDRPKIDQKKKAKENNKGKVKGPRVLRRGEKLEGKVAKLDPKSRSLMVKTDKGLVRVPVVAGLQARNGDKGRFSRETLAKPHLLVADTVVFVFIESDGMVSVTLPGSGSQSETKN